MSDTPETDAALYPMDSVDVFWPEFARKLERSMNNNRQIAEKYETIYFSTLADLDELKKQLAVSQAERDEYKIKSEYFQKWTNELLLLMNTEKVK